jgi:hypothetical protein
MHKQKNRKSGVCSYGPSLRKQPIGMLTTELERRLAWNPGPVKGYLGFEQNIAHCAISGAQEEIPTR